MRVLVIGGTGFIGYKVVEKLVLRTQKVVVMSRRSRVFPEEFSGKVESVTGDIREFSDIMRVLRDFKIDSIINIAYALTAEGEANPLAAIQVNCLGACNIFEAARLFNVKRVTFCSSIAAYGNQECYGDRPVTEEDILMKPAFLYGATKMLTEFVASRYEKKYGLEAPILRISCVYGLGREERGLTAWTSEIISSVVRGKSVLIPVPSEMPASFISISDVAEQIARICLLEKLHYKVYNSGGCTAKVKEFSEIAKRYYPDANIKYDENASPWPYVYKIDGARIANEINYEVRDLHGGLVKMLNQERHSLGLKPLKIEN